MTTFRDAIIATGLVPPDSIVPGKFHKFPGEGKRASNRAGWCKLFPDGLAGVFGDFASGFSADWHAQREGAYTPAEIESFKRQAAEAKAQAEAERKAKADEAAKQSLLIWSKATQSPGHAYCDAKGILMHLARMQFGHAPECKHWFWTTDDNGELIELTGKLLLLPLYSIGGELRGLQAIDELGRKSLIRGLDKRGLFIPLTGGKLASDYAGNLYFGEGFSTVATIRQATDQPAVAAIDAGNLLHVAEAWRKKLPSAEIIIAGDFDRSGTGQKAAMEAAHAVHGPVALPPFSDVDLAAERPPSDWNDYAALHGIEATKHAIEAATLPGKGNPANIGFDVTRGDSKGRIVVVSLMDFVTREIQPRERILAPWLLTQSLNMLYAWRGVGKTHVALGIAYAVASGGRFLKWQAQHPRRVLYLDGEMPAASMQDRLKALVASNDDDFDPDYFRLVTPDLQTGCMPDLATEEGQNAIENVIGDTELIVCDNLSSLARSGGRENDAESWLPIQPWALRQRQQGRSVLFIHHSGKGGAQRGTSKKEDILDTVLTLKRPSDYNPADGAVFEVHFEKTRDMHGEDAQPFEARLQANEQGQSVWAFSSVEDSTFDRVVSLASQGLSQKEIAEELDINKSTVSRHFKKAADAGLITKGSNYASF